MTKKQIRLHKLGNASRTIKGGENTPPRKDKAAIAQLRRRLEICKAHGDLESK